jgi:hypothetical protein
MHLVSPLPSRSYQAHRFQNLQVLWDRLSAEHQLMFHCQTTAQFEQSLAVALDQFVKNGPSRWSRKCLEEITHGRTW